MEGQTASLAWLERHGSALHRHLEQILARERSPEMLRKPPGLVLEVSNERDESISSDGCRAVAHLGRAQEFVGRPLHLWLENGRNDSAFLRAAAPAGEYRRWLEDARTKRWIEYRLGGGSELGPVLEALDPWDRLRAWAMCDADNWEPAHDPPRCGPSARRVGLALILRPDPSCRCASCVVAPSRTICRSVRSVDGQPFGTARDTSSEGSASASSTRSSVSTLITRTSSFATTITWRGASRPSPRTSRRPTTPS